MLKLDLSDFWENCEYATKEYVGKAITQEMIAEVEEVLGYKLPEYFLVLLKSQNGGIPKNTNFPTQ